MPTSMKEAEAILTRALETGSILYRCDSYNDAMSLRRALGRAQLAGKTLCAEINWDPTRPDYGKQHPFARLTISPPLRGQNKSWLLSIALGSAESPILDESRIIQPTVERTPLEGLTDLDDLILPTPKPDEPQG